MRHKASLLLGLFTAIIWFAGQALASPREEVFNTPQSKIGRDIGAWIESLGRPADCNVEKGGLNRHSGEPVVFVTLTYPEVVGKFWLNSVAGNSLLVEMVTESRSFLDTLDLPFSVDDRSTWTTLGKPVSSDDSVVRFSDCAEWGCSHIEITTNEQSFELLNWSWEAD